ncbi:MAG: glycosyl transferase family 2 [Cellvibrionales bacterium]|nr:glycosyl transferase family 2 [Cellvibrionales bacterium]|tara:strand:+ start:1514 stop:2461 length:948 start_codon:yes stop_codon:yes gene_type:complete
MPDIAVVICTYNRYALLEAAIESCLSQTLSIDKYEIWIIDNTPNAELGEGRIFAERYKKIANLHYIFEKTAGLSNARNVAFRLTSTPYITYLDDDAIASSDLLNQVIKGFSEFDNVGIVGGKISPIWEVKRPPWLGDKLLGSVSVVDWGGYLRIAGHDEWFAGANISFSRSALAASGGFPTNLGRKGGGQVLLSNEENAVIEEITACGFLSVYNPEAAVDHLVEEKRLSRDWFRRRSAWQAVSDFMMTPSDLESQVPAFRENIKNYLLSLPPVQRNLQGFYFKTDDPGIFNWQLSAIYGLTVMNLSGFGGLEDVK